MPGNRTDTALPAYTTRGLTKVYGQGRSAVHALRGVDLEIPASEIVVLLGPSGSGKSALLNIIGGLDRGTAGEVLFRDQTLSDMTESELTLYRRNHVGFVFQFYNLMPSLTARENVELVTEIAADPMDPGEALALVGLKERTDHFPAQLSIRPVARIPLHDCPRRTGSGRRTLWRHLDGAFRTCCRLRHGGRVQ